MDVCVLSDDCKIIITFKVLPLCVFLHLHSLFSSIRRFLRHNFFPFPPSSFLIPSLSPPAGSSRLAQSDAMVVIGCPLPQIRSQLALGVLWRLPITPHPTDQGLTPERLEDRQAGKG